MGRELPSPPEIHHIAFHAFLIASLLASLAFLAAICVSCHHRKPKKAPPLGEKVESLGPTSKADIIVAVGIENEKQETEKQEEDITELEGEIHGPMPEMSKSKRRLSMSSSMGLQARLSMLKTGRREKRNEEDETLWKKTIIMGEKNKVPPWEEEEEEAVGKFVGENCRRNYRPRSLPVSPMKRVAGDVVRPMTAF